MPPCAAGILLPERFCAFQTRNAVVHTQKGAVPAGAWSGRPAQKPCPVSRCRRVPGSVCSRRALPERRTADLSRRRVRRHHRTHPPPSPAEARKAKAFRASKRVKKVFLTRFQTETGFRLSRLALRCAYKFCAQRKIYTLLSASSIFCDVHAAAENDPNHFCACGRKTLRDLLTV